MRTTSGTRPRAVLATLATAVFMVMFDNLAMNNAIPRMGRELGVGITGLQWIVAVYTLLLAALLLSGSVVGERLGRRRVFLTGVTVFMAGAAIGSAAGSWQILVLGRAVQGVGGAALMPASAALTRQVFADDARRAKALGVRGGAAGLGLAMGPVIGGVLVEAFGWPSVLLINVPVGAVILVAGIRVLPGAPPDRTRHWDLPGQALAALAAGSLVYGLVQGPLDGWGDPVIVGAFALAATALPTLVVVEQRRADPMLDPAFFRDRVCAAASLACFSTSAGLFGSVFFLSLYLQYVLGWPPAGAGLVFLLASALIVVSGPLAGRISARRGAARPLALGVALCPLPLLGLSWYGTRAAYAQYCWVLPIVGACVGLTFVGVSVAVVQRVPAARAGMASAVIETARELGGTVGVAALGAVLNSRMAAALRAEAASAGLAHAQADGLVRQVMTHGPEAGFGSAGTSAAAQAWVAHAFVEALHAALRVGAAATALVVPVVVLALGLPRLADAARRRPPAAARGPAAAADDGAEAP